MTRFDPGRHCGADGRRAHRRVTLAPVVALLVYMALNVAVRMWLRGDYP